MSKYIENNLGKDEKILIKAKKNPLYLVPSIIWMVIILVVAIIVPIILKKTFEGDLTYEAADFLYNGGLKTVKIVCWVVFALFGLIPFIARLLKFLSINLALTNKRVVGKEGILRVNALDIHIDKIDHVQIKAGIFGNLFKYYSLQVISVGGSGYDSRNNREGAFVGIGNATQFKNAVTNAVEIHAEEARKAQATEIAKAMRGESN